MNYEKIFFITTMYLLYVYIFIKATIKLLHTAKTDTSKIIIAYIMMLTAFPSGCFVLAILKSICD